MAVHTLKAYSDSINRFSPKYDAVVCQRMNRSYGLIWKLMQAMQVQMMVLDMLKAYIFYGKEVHECIEAQLLQDAAVTPSDPAFTQFWHGVLGVMTECNELYLEQDRFGMKKINGVGEGGDILWFTNELCKALGCTLAEAAAVNEAKLSTRYGEAHDAGKAIKRDKAAEEAAMSAALAEVRAAISGDLVTLKKREEIKVPELVEQYRKIMDMIHTRAVGDDLRNAIKQLYFGIMYKGDAGTFELLAQAMPALEDACRHNASAAQRITLAQIRSVLGLEPITFKHGVNYDANGQEVPSEVRSPQSDDGQADAGSAADS